MNLKPLYIFVGVVLTVLVGLWIRILPIPLNGTHEWRQADTLITAYFYCTEDLDFGRPKVAARNGTSGIAVGEFPLYSYMDGLLCRAQGAWSEVTPKLLNLVFLILAFFAWLRFLQRRFGRRPHDLLLWLIVFIMSPISLSFLTIPMPESTALALFGFAACLWQLSTEKNSKSLDALASLVFILAFMVRPYHIYILFFIAPNRRRMGEVLVLCVAGFFLWYRWWAARVTTLPGYFGINFEGAHAILVAGLDAIKAVPNRLFDQTAIVGLWLLWKGKAKSRLAFWGFLASWATMMILKPEHLPSHSYYLMNAAFFAACLMFLGLRELPRKQVLIFGFLFVAISVSDVFHNFMPSRESPEALRVWAERQKLDPNGTVVTYQGNNPKWLYYLKAIGTMKEVSEYQGPEHCPPKITSLLYRDPQGELRFELCKPGSVTQ